MGAVGAVGGVGGGLGSIGDAGSSSGGGESGPIMAPDPTTSFTQGWFNANAVMDTSGETDGSSVSLDDADLKAGIGTLEKQRPEPPPANCDTCGVGDSPSAEVVDKVASVYAANRME